MFLNTTCYKSRHGLRCLGEYKHLAYNGKVNTFGTRTSSLGKGIPKMKNCHHRVLLLPYYLTIGHLLEMVSHFLPLMLHFCLLIVHTGTLQQIAQGPIGKDFCRFRKAVLLNVSAVIPGHHRDKSVSGFLSYSVVSDFQFYISGLEDIGG